MNASSSLDPRIERFIRRHHVATLTTDGVEGMASFHAFYAWVGDTPLPMLVFTSSPSTLHGGRFSVAAAEGCPVSGGIVLETRTVAKVQGLQLTGLVRPAAAMEKLLSAARKAYLKRFPYAAASEGVRTGQELWVMELTGAKYTDNTLGFGTRLLWPTE